ncbi:MAG: aldo/keto reductase [Victivallaceae bacterium]
MKYRKLGNTGIEISALGFGAMRLPMKPDTQGVARLSMDESIDVLRYGFEQGINYVDTAYGYCGGESEIAVGRALKNGWRDKVYLSTKLPLWSTNEKSDFRRILGEQLRKLDVSHIDFYHFHAAGADSFNNKILKFGLIEEAMKAKEQGLIRFLSFSFHDKPEEMLPIIDTGAFDSVLCQYNLLDRGNEPSFKYAAEKGLGVIIMGPVGGGRLAFAGSVFEEAIANRITTPELALHFVLGNSYVNCALSGMSTRQMVDENVKIASMDSTLSQYELSRIDDLLEKCKSLSSLYCTGCGYCMPCPFEVNIPVCLEALIYHKVYRMEQAAKDKYAAIGGEWVKGKTAYACTNCGACEQKCPQKIPVRQRLAEAAAIFGK